jgi:hypothetical protein
MICGECNFLNSCPAAHSGVKMAHDDPACDIGLALAESEVRGFAMAAGQCCVEGGLLGDDYGHEYCSLEKEVERLKTFGALLPAGVAEVMTGDKNLAESTGDESAFLQCEKCGQGQRVWLDTCKDCADPGIKVYTDEIKELTEEVERLTRRNAVLASRASSWNQERRRDEPDTT